MVPIRALKI